MQLRTRTNKCIKVSALSFPTICSPLTQRVYVSLYPHLQHLDFADDFDGTDAVDVLIGADFYWDIVGEESIRGEDGPTALNSMFGWILSGPTNTGSATYAVVLNLIISGDPAKQRQMMM